MTDNIKSLYINHVLINSSAILTEELHPEIHQLLGAHINSYDRRSKITSIANRVRELTERGEQPGLTDDKPKQGSSRAVFFTTDHHEAKIDGVPAKIPHVIKIAIRGTLDRYRQPTAPLLGEMQSLHEIESSKEHSVLTKGEDGNFTTNPHGFLPPLIDHEHRGKWMSVVKIAPITSRKFTELTKTPDFPHGLTHKTFLNAISYHYDNAHGYTNMSDPHMDDLILHPLVNNVLRYCAKTNTVPHDFERRNLGIWQHPVTGQEHIVASDAGFSFKVMLAYQAAQEARLNRIKK